MNALWKLALVAITLILTACASTNTGPTRGPWTPSILMHNAAIEPVDLVWRPASGGRAFKIGTVYPGRTECFAVRVGGVPAGVPGLAYHASRTVEWAAVVVDLGQSDGWALSASGVGWGAHDLAGLRPFGVCSAERNDDSRRAP